MNFTYKTITEAAEALFKDRGSKFLAFAYPFPDKEKLKEILNELRAQHNKAVHFCYAYRCGLDGDDYRANDDGEPSGSAGRPILGQIDSLGLSSVLVVVVRYFGGTLLGVPGLINAYKTAAAMVLAEAHIEERPIEEYVRLEFDYPKMSEVMHWCKHYQVSIRKQDMGLFCSLELGVPRLGYQDFLEKIESIYGVDIKTKSVDNTENKNR